MTEETQEKKQSRGKLLVIDDNPKYVFNAIRATRARGYEVDVAFDLKGAMSYLQSREYAGVITDLQFFEEGERDSNSGINTYKLKDPSDLEGIVDAQTILEKDNSGKNVKINLFQRETQPYIELIETLKRSKITPYSDDSFYELNINPRVNQEIRQRIASELATPEYANQLLGLKRGSKELERLFSEYSLENLQKNIMQYPPAGYEVIKYAQEHNIPIAVVTSVGHGQHCIPALLKTGLASVDSIVRHEQIRDAEFNRTNNERWSELGSIDRLYSSGNLSREERSEREKKCEEKYINLLQNFAAILLDKVVLVMWDAKGEYTYNFAIDMLEGRIDQTRPYTVGS